MYISFLKHRKIYFIFSLILIIAAISCLFIFGLKPGIDFTGGSILEVEFSEERPSIQEMREKLAGLDLGEIIIQPAGEKGAIIRMKEISENVHQEIIRKLKDSGEGGAPTGELEERRFESIGPTIGMELKQKTKVVIIFSLISILFYVALAFRRISRPVASWQYGIAAILALFHDTLIPLGIFSILGKFYGVQITIPVTVALLTVLGYSINNTVVVFDRIRENLFKTPHQNLVGGYEEIVDKSLNETLTRQINTSLTTLFVLVAIFFFGGETLKYFALILILGITAGTYSSIFLASPILVSWLRWRKSA